MKRVKKIIKPVVIIALGLCLFACSKKTTSKASKTKTVPGISTQCYKTTTTVATTTEYKEPIWVSLDFGDYNTYYIDDKY